MIDIQNVRKILIPRFDTHGDIVLLSGFLQALIQKCPDVEITLLVREGYDQLSAVLPARIRWITTRIYPYKNYDPNDHDELDSLVAKLTDGKWELLLSTNYTRTWLDDFVAAALSRAQRVAMGEPRQGERWLGQLFEVWGLNPEPLWDNYVPVDAAVREIEKYKIFIRQLIDCGGEELRPRLIVSSQLLDQADAVATDIGLKPGGFFVCLPAGTQNVSIKGWSLDRFAEVIDWACSKYDLPVLLVGQENEREVLSSVAAKVQVPSDKIFCWTGKSGELPLLVALMRRARFYVGNDSGPMHIAAAHGIPTVGVFGGGYWPRFLPVGPLSVGVAGQLPCFGCDWDCAFIDAPCVRLVEVSDVTNAISDVVAEVENVQNFVPVADNVSAETEAFIRSGYRKYEWCKAAQKELAGVNSVLMLEKAVSGDTRKCKSWITRLFSGLFKG